MDQLERSPGEKFAAFWSDITAKRDSDPEIQQKIESLADSLPFDIKDLANSSMEIVAICEELLEDSHPLREMVLVNENISEAKRPHNVKRKLETLFPMI